MDDPSGAGRNAVAAGAAKAGVAIRYRLAADGLWSDYAPDRKGFAAPAAGAAYWRSIERTPGCSRSPRRTNYGFGYQFMRCLMACEDEPDYLIGGGDMNGIRLSDTMGRSWFHAESNGLRCPASTRCSSTRATTTTCSRSATWLVGGTNTTSQQARCGVWRSTDFGATWSARPADG